MLLVADNDVQGAVAVLVSILESGEWAEYAAFIELQFRYLADLGISSDCTDPELWRTCQEASAVLITANRSGGPDSLDETIRQKANKDSLPVLTLVNQSRVLRDRAYAHRCAERLIDYLDQISALRGSGRLFIP